MEVVLVRQKGILFIAEAMQDDADDVEHRDNQGREGDYHLRVPEVGVRWVFDAQMDSQHTEDVAQGQTARITHEKFVAALGIAEDIVEPERD